jgi:ABC-2 type transport system permease protein
MNGRKEANLFIVRLMALRIKSLWRRLLQPRPGRTLQLASYLLVMAVFLGGGFLLFHRLFLYLVSLESIGPPLMARILSTAFLAFMLMLFLSSLVTSLSTLYHSPEIDFLLASPLPFRQLFLYRLAYNVFYSSWATLLLGIPLLAAVFSALRTPVLGVAAACLMFPLFILIPALAAVALLQLAVKLFPRLSLKSLLGFMFLAMAAGSWLFFAFGQPQSISIGRINSPAELEQYLAGLAVTSHALLPSTWMAQGLLAPAEAGPGFLAVRLWMLLITAVFVGWLCLSLAERFYHQSLLGRVSSGSRPGPSSRLLSSRLGRRFPVAAKDALLFVRNPVQWAQAFIFVSLLVLYLGSLRRYPVIFTFDQWKVLVSFINFGFAGYILATLSVRFVFPTFSLEGPMLWLVRTAPVSVSRLFFEKAFLNAAVALLLAEALSLASNRLLNTPPGLGLLSHLCLAVMCLAVTGISLGLGAAWPDYRETNPSRIASGLGGMLAALVSLSYVGISIVVLAWPAYLYALNRWQGRASYHSALSVSLLLFILISAAFTFIPLRLGLRSLAVRDV